MPFKPNSRVALLGLVGAVTAGSVLMLSASRTGARAHDAKEHAHSSRHGGAIQAIGNHHVEAVLEKGGRLRVYLLGKDEAQLTPAPLPEVVAQVQGDDEVESAPVTLSADPQPGDPNGQSSSFLGQLPESLVGAPVTVAMTLPLEGKGYRARFELKPHRADEVHPEMLEMLSMPGGAGADEVSALYATPGGRYTEADIRANGTQSAAAKYRGIQSSHDMNPRPGDRICPITSTKANPRFVWTIGGKEYRFCCPPCIDEFVQRAKKQPESIQEPESYVQR